ncbi:MAG: rhodanese-like domain-containing protein, partial [Arenimonas sp.]|nr:rhodanese-like domain-containing protein [Arenimonas sp.]
MNRRFLTIAGLLLALLLPTLASAAKPAVSPAAVDELAKATDAPLLLDVRSPEEFAAGHLPGAVNIPHDQVAGRLDELDRSRWVLVYCRSGRRAGVAEEALADGGFDVRQIEGSWQRWEAEGRPVV